MSVNLKEYILHYLMCCMIRLKKTVIAHIKTCERQGITGCQILKTVPQSHGSIVNQAHLK